MKSIDSLQSVLLQMQVLFFHRFILKHGYNGKNKRFQRKNLDQTQILGIKYHLPKMIGLLFKHYVFYFVLAVNEFHSRLSTLPDGILCQF